MAINSPLLEASIEGARGVLISVAGGSDMGLFEINEAARMVSEAVHPEANIIFGTVIDDTLGDEVRVTVIAAGFDGGTPQPRKTAATGRALLGKPGLPTDKPASATAPVRTDSTVSESISEPVTAGAPTTIDLTSTERKAEVGRPLAPTSRTIAFDDTPARSEDLDIPDFLK